MNFEQTDFEIKLSSIKKFRNYLTEIIERGYMNNSKTVESLAELISTYYEKRIEPASNMFDINAFMEVPDGCDSASEDESISSAKIIAPNINIIEDQDTLNINEFIENSTNIDIFHIYKKSHESIKRMHKFIDNMNIY